MVLLLVYILFKVTLRYNTLIVIFESLLSYSVRPVW